MRRRRRPRVDASLRNPNDIVFAPDGSMLDQHSERHNVRRIAPDGTISTFAGGLHATSWRTLRPTVRMPVLGDASFAYARRDLYFTPCRRSTSCTSTQGITHLFAKHNL